MLRNMIRANLGFPPAGSLQRRHARSVHMQRCRPQAVPVHDPRRCDRAPPAHPLPGMGLGRPPARAIVRGRAGAGSLWAGRTGLDEDLHACRTRLSTVSVLRRLEKSAFSFITELPERLVGHPLRLSAFTLSCCRCHPTAGCSSSHAPLYDAQPLARPGSRAHGNTDVASPRWRRPRVCFKPQGTRAE